MYEYVTKEDCNCVKSPHHPENVIAPKTLKATRKKSKKGSRRSKKAQKVSTIQYADIILKNNIHTMLEVLAYANTRKGAGDLSTYQFALDRGQKVSEVLKSVWDIESAKEKRERSSHSPRASLIAA